MNNESGSALQKANFTLLILIASALAYLIVRERIRSHRVEAGSQEGTDTVAIATPPVNNTASPEESRSSFAPLRPRVDTNAVRKIVGSSIVSPKNTTVLRGHTAADSSNPVVTQTAAVAVEPSTYVPGVGGSARGTLASVIGRVTLSGAPPPEKQIQMDAMCGRLIQKPAFTRHYVVGRDAGLANVFVYVREGAAADKSNQSSTPVLENVGCEFEPYVMGVRAGQPFTLRNSDKVLHNMHFMPKPGSGNREVNLGMPVPMSSTRVFDKPEVFIKVKCDVHPWMFAYIGVVDHPWFAVTDNNGNFALPAGLPKGRYVIAAVHLKAGEAVQELNISEGGPPPLNFTLEVPSTAQTNAR
jgi:plastocyanin